MSTFEYVLIALAVGLIAGLYFRPDLTALVDRAKAWLKAKL